MDFQRVLLVVALGLITMMLWEAWQREHQPPAPQVTEQQAVATPQTPGEVPEAPAAPTATTAAPTPATPEAQQLPHASRITVVTDAVEAEIDTAGGDLRALRLRKYPQHVETPDQPVQLVNEAADALYITQDGLIGAGSNYPNHKTQYIAAQTRYELADGADHVDVPLSYTAPDGVRYTKIYRFYRNQYLIDIHYRIENGSGSEWQGYLYGQFLRADVPSKERYGIMSAVPSYTGGAIYSPEEKFHKVDFKTMRSERLQKDVTGGWVAMLQHYFVGAWLPAADTPQQFYSRDLGDGLFNLGFKATAPTSVAPGASGEVGARLYVGPKEQKRLRKLADGLVLSVDYGWLTPVSAPLFWVLQHIHNWVGNWGWAIIIVTFLIKLVFYPLSAASYKSMAKMRKITPRMQSLKERYGDDKQKFQQAMMELYKTEKINPMGGCLPILIQIPVFIALYWVLLESVEMRQAPFALWINDLSSKDPYFVLPILMGISMFVQQWLSPSPATDPLQRKMMMALPAIFTVFFLFFPAGLVLYWFVNNVLSIAQQWRITHIIEKQGR